ncbi:MAG: hypothetical protein ABIH18_08725 [Candidatus Omnitrophota bacterium]
MIILSKAVIVINVAIIGVFSLIIGLLLAINPVLSIEIQRRFYERINWRMEPISMEKEIRNTRIMGIFLTLLAIVILGIIIFRRIA